LDVVVREGSAILKLLSGEDQSLLVWRDSFLVLNLGFDVLNGVSGFDIQSDSLSSESLDEDLHTSSKSEDQVECGFLLNVVVRECSAVLKLLSGKNESLLIWWDSFFVLDLGFDIFDGIGWLDIKCNCLTSKGFDEDLHATTESENEMESGLLLDVVVTEGSTILQLLSGENESLLVWWDPFFILDLSFDVFNGVSWFNVQCDGFSSKSLDEDLHTTSKSEDEMKCGLFLDVVVTEGSAILKLLSGEDESLLIWWNTFFILDLGLDILN